jgi:hypothetical protein
MRALTGTRQQSADRGICAKEGADRALHGTAQRAASWFVLLIKYYAGDQINKNKMGRACGTYGRLDNCVEGFGGGDMRERDHLKDPGADGRSNSMKGTGLN